VVLRAQLMSTREKPCALPSAREFVYKKRSLTRRDEIMKVKAKNRSKARRRRAALAKKHSKARLRASSGHQKF